MMAGKVQRFWPEVRIATTELGVFRIGNDNRRRFRCRLFRPVRHDTQHRRSDVTRQEASGRDQFPRSGARRSPGRLHRSHQRSPQ